MTQHIGIVACSAEGAALCYRAICTEAPQLLGQHAHPQVCLHGHSLADYVRRIERADWAGVAELMLDSAQRLAAAGAQFLICPDNTIHQALGWVTPSSPLPWLHIAQVVAEQAVACGYRRLGLTGTRWLVDSEVYPQQLVAYGLECVRPGVEEREALNRIIMDELVCGVFKSTAITYLQDVVQRLREQSCDAVILGCTELPLVLSDANSTLPTLDSTRLLARAAVRRALSNP